MRGIQTEIVALVMMMQLPLKELANIRSQLLSENQALV